MYHEDGGFIEQVSKVGSSIADGELGHAVQQRVALPH